MLKLAWKILLWVAIAAAGGLGLYTFLSLEGMTAIEFLGREYSMRTSVFLALSGLVFAAVWFAIYLLRSGVGGIAGMFDFFRRARHRSGLSALAKSLAALEEGDGKTAMAAAAKAERMLDNPDLTRLVNAKAAELAGAKLRAERYYEAMALDDDTEFLGVRGLLRRALEEKKPERALKLAERAHQLRPREGETLDTMLTLQRRKGDWAGARKSIEAQVRAGRLTRDVGERRRAVLLLSDAIDKEAKGDVEGATKDAQAAAKLSPGLAPAAAMSARLSMAKGERRSAGRTLITAWRHEPHPEIAEAYAALQPDESAEARLKRFDRLFGANPRAVETKLLEAELGIAAGKTVLAREAVEAALTAGPSARAYALMAAIEQTEGAEEGAVRAWLAKATSAPRSAHWVCDNCGTVASRWAHACGGCGAFDTLSWKAPEDEDEATGLSKSLLLPLLETPAPKASNGAATTAVETAEEVDEAATDEANTAGSSANGAVVAAEAGPEPRAH